MEGYYIDVFVSHEFVQVDKDVLVSSEFDPHIDRRLLLDVADNRVELDVLLSFHCLQHFEAHRVFTFVVEGQFFAIDVAQQTDLEIVKLSFYTYRHFDAFSLERYDDGRRVQYVFNRQQQL